MGRYLARRLVLAVVTLFGISVLTFTLSRIIPGDPARLAAGPSATPSSIVALRKEMGLDQPVPVQFRRYLVGLVHLDFGQSVITRGAVRDDLTRYFPATLELILFAFLIYFAIGVPLGVMAALTHGRWPDLVIRLGANIGYAIPLFLTALWLQYFFYYKWGLFPSGGRLPILVNPPPHRTGLYLIDSLLAGKFWLFSQALYHLLLPGMALALSLLAIAARFTRASLLSELGKEYVRVARLKGLSRFQIVVKHALRNSLIPVLTMTGVQFGYFVGGSVLVETVFLWPGTGLYAYNAINNVDYAPIMGVTLVTSFVFVMTNLAIDLLYPVLDPRIRLTGRR